MLFTDEELAGLSVPLPLRIQRALDRNETKIALELNEEMRRSRVVLHDFFAESCTVLWSFVGQTLGEDRVEDMFRHVFSQSATRQFLDATAAGAPAWLSALLLAKSWRAHSCFGAGDHPARFSITEDGEKFTFHLAPCASGARLWLKGMYEKKRGGKVTETAHPWSYNRKGLPYYCIHCAFLNEILPYESPYGVLMWPVDPLKDPASPCAWHVYKNPGAIPESYYARLGLAKRPGPKNRCRIKTGRYFSDVQLEEMARPVPDRIEQSIRAGRFKEAKRLCREVRDEFLVLHDLYVNMLCATLTFIAREAGEDALGRALEMQFEKCVRNPIVAALEALDPRQKAAFLANRIFGADAVNGSGYWPSNFTVRETSSQVVFTLKPCGSGGRLLASGAYLPMGPFRNTQEKLENWIVRTAVKIPLPDAVLERAFPLIVNHFTQRKPHDQGRTRKAHAWSFGEKGVPYYCCQCGMTARKLRDKGLSITPPTAGKAPCVWALDKEILA